MRSAELGYIGNVGHLSSVISRVGPDEKLLFGIINKFNIYNPN